MPSAVWEQRTQRRGGHLNGEQHELKVEAVWIVVP